MDSSVAAVVGGFAGLTVGAELLVRGGARAARTLGVSTLVIGLTLVAYGTSAPEMVASLVAALYGHPDVTLGNVVGSNIANIGLILGTTALVAPFAVLFRMVRRELIFMMAVTVLFYGLALRGGFGRPEGVLFLVALVAFNILSLRWAKAEPPELEKELAAFEWEVTEKVSRSLLWDLLLVMFGLGLLFAGGHFLVMGAIDIARRAGLSETVIGMTLVAVGTSLPELATSVVAAMRGEAAICVGNLIGSNLFNILGAIGISAAVRPFEANASMLAFEFPLLIFFSLVMVLVLGSGRKVKRREGAFLLAGYGAFMAAVLIRAAG